MAEKQAADFAGTDRFEIWGRIGAGAMGVVYRAYDRERKATVALKHLRRVDPAALLRFKQEFRSLTDVTHRNLIQLFELVSAGEEWFFTMELVPGVDFLSYVRGDASHGGPQTADSATQTGAFARTSSGSVSTLSRDEAGLRDEDAAQGEATADTMPPLSLPPATTVVRRLPTASSDSLSASSDGKPAVARIAPPATAPAQLDRLRRALIQLADGVMALHDAGQLHRDLKPSNVLVTTDQRVVVLDFGVVTELAAQRLPGGNEQVVGTPAFMAPEQASGGRVTEASDWYSFGVMLYEALTGRRPFVGSVRDVLAAKQRSDPRPPRTISQDIPEDLDQLCVYLLARDPQARPRGQEILDRLGAGERRTHAAAVRSPRAGAPLIGRSAHLAILDQAYAAVGRGEPRTVFVHGTSGIGKTALLTHFLGKLQDAGEAVVLASRCYERESVPYKALDNLIDALTHQLLELPRRRVWDLMPPGVYALARLFPVLKRVEAVMGASRTGLENLDPLDLRRVAFDALRELLRHLAARGPLVLYIDDLQWGDLDSASLLERMLRPPGAPAVLLLASYRREDAASSAFLRAFLPTQSAAISLSLDPLSRTEARELAISLYGDPGANREVVVRLADSIARESRGDPLFVDELVRFFKRSAEAQKHASLGGDVSLEDVLWARLEELAEGPRRLLEVVAVAGQPVSQAVALRAADLSAEEQAAMALLRNSHLVRTRGVRDRDPVECYHDRIRIAVIDYLSADHLRECHKRLAGTLEAAGEADPETLAIHFDGAGAADRAGHYYALAAEQAADALAFDRAASLYRRSHALRPLIGAEAAQLHGRLGHALRHAGRLPEAACAYQEASRTARATDALELRRLAAEAYLAGGHLEEGERMLREVLEVVGLHLARTPRRAIARVLRRRAWVRLRGLGGRARVASQVAPQEISRIDACWTAALGLAMCDHIRGADFQTRHLLYALRSGERSHVARALAAESAFASLPGRRGARRALRVAERAVKLAHEVGDPVILGWAIGSLGLVRYQLGDFKLAHDRCYEAEQLVAKLVGEAWELSTIRLYKLWAFFYLGSFGEIARLVPAMLEQVQDRGDLYSATNLVTGLPNVAWLVKDDVTQARTLAQAMMERWSRQGYHLQHYWHFLARQNIEIYARDGRAAWHDVQSEWPALQGSFLRTIFLVRVESLLARARSALAAAVAGGDRPKLARAVERDARRLAREQVGFTSALALLCRAGAAAVRGDTEQSVALLAEAGPALEGADMRLWAAAAHYRRGQLVGGDEGATLCATAEQVMRAEDIVNPAAMVGMLAPGFEN
jgi:serine/threonine protein kinase